ncbi:prepilin peptidase [Pandoraea sp.]|uniref:A24 family peptidase n=1 Tax=Pandoraea sp. TaxID=1883445 RepID=UPI001229FE85|nr:prepilin peptidase [Pandoraea sp.]TAL57052.1 MAG: pilus assembly protein CpaA [Pandoraea sp.]TAM18095.1 MAG: pilus assembly protein CpaA [Pandoraea sp.]
MNAFEFPVGACVLGLVGLAAAWDLHARRIPNWLVLLGLVVALAVQWGLRGASAGIGQWLGGLAVGFGLFMPIYLLRGMSAGDVKLMAAVGAFVGPAMALEIVLGTWAIGGVLALGAIVRERAFRASGSSLLAIFLSGTSRARWHAAPASAHANASMGTLPYAVAIALGTVGVMFLHAAGHVL